MKIFEQMKAALESQAPVVDEPKNVNLTPTFMGTPNISIQQVPGYTQPLLFQVGDKVSYQTPVIKTPTDYSWAWHHGTVKEISEQLEMVIISPSLAPEKWIGIPFVYVRPYEKNELNEIMEEEENGQEGS